MDNPSAFTPAKSAGLFDRIGAFLSRHLTITAIAVGVVGTAIFVLGATRAFANRSDGNGALEGVQAAVEQAAGAISGSGATTTIGQADTAKEFERGLVPYTIIPDRPRNKVTTYTVQPGDTLIGIANTFSLDRNTIFWANTDTLRGDVHMLRPNMDLYILPTDGVYHKSDGNMTLQQIADKYSVDVNAIINSEYNELEGETPAYVPKYSTRIVIPGGQGEFADWRPPVQETVDEATGQVVSAFMPGMAGSCAPGIRGSGGTGSWSLPLQSGFAFTQAFYPGHSGVDLATPVGTPVVAADTGVVVFSGWVLDSWGYGIVVVLDHGNGWTTYYAHLSSNGVGCGQLVQRGQYLGQSGSTGNSSGPHLHFEMRWGHEPVDPVSYIGF